MRIPSQLHFVGIGGVGMSAVAQVWHDRGGRVSGSDIQVSPTVRRLRDHGVRISLGHDRGNIEPLWAETPSPDLGVVVSTAVQADNPEVVAARENGVPIFHRSEVLAALMGSRRSIAVTGTHGKTTTTGMIGTILLEGGLDPTILVGGDLPNIAGNARTGGGDLLVAEADESDKSILRLTAEWVVVTNLESDHLDHYRDIDDIIDTMATFINRLPADSKVVACVDDPGVRALLPKLQRQVYTYGWSAADFRITNEQLSATGSSFQVNGDSYEVRVPGRHNVSNAAAAVAIATLAGLDAHAIWSALPKFTGVGRRFQLRGVAAGVHVLEDYAHHPSEIKATLQTAKLLKRPVWVVFQPHRFSRTSALLEEFASSFEEATGVAIMDIYSAGEAPNGVSSRDLVDKMGKASPAVKSFYWPDHQSAEEGVDSQIKSGDIVILMGAGNVNRLAEPLLERLRLREAAVATSHPA